jgi:hypothetical protein
MMRAASPGTWTDMPERREQAARFSLPMAVALYAIAFGGIAWPWLSGAVAIPYDAKSQFYPQFAFLARSLADGQWPFWTPNVFAGWPQIADPQSQIFSLFHLAAAWLSPVPDPRLTDWVVLALLFAGGLGVILFCRDRGWHIGGALVAALAFAFGGSAASRIQHIGQVESLAFLPLALWMLQRALTRSSFLAGAASGVFAAFVVLGRDQVSLLAVYVLAGYVLWHWFDGDGAPGRIRASVKPLVAGAIAGALIVVVPVTLTALLAGMSNRPEIGYHLAGRGSLHPAHLLMLVFADVYGASDFARDFWGPPGFPWHETFGDTDLFAAQNAGQVYVGALAAVTVIGLGIARGQLWAREIRFFTVMALLAILYALGKYTPAFRAMYDFMPGVSLYRRPADASFIFCALLAIITGYLVHRRLTDAAPPRWWQHLLAIAVWAGLIALAVWLAIRVGMLDEAWPPILWGVGFAAAAVVALRLARRYADGNAVAAAAVLCAFSVADFAWNNAPNESTGLPPSQFEALRANTRDETVALLKARLKAAAAPDRRDRVELIGVGYHWPNIGLIHDFDHLFGHNPLRLSDFARATNAPDTVAGPDQRVFSPLLPSYRSTLEDLFGVRFIAIGVPIEQVDPSVKPGDFPLIARTDNAYVYENPRALPRVMLVGNWRHANFADMIRTGRWPDFDPRRTVLLEQPPRLFVPGTPGGSVRIVSYRNTEVAIETDAPAASMLVLNDIWHPWWRACVGRRETDILQANVLFRAVEVPAGKHVVRFSFHPFAGAFGALWPGLSRSQC